MINQRRKHFKNFFCESGSALMGILAAVAIGAIVSLAMSSLIVKMQHAGNNVKFRTDSDSFTEEVRAMLSSQTSCTNSFNNLLAAHGAEHTIDNLYDGTPPPGQIAYTTGDIYGDRTLILERMTLSDYVVGSDVSKAVMTLHITTRTVKKSTGAQIVARKINIHLERNTATNAIISCVALARMSDGLWQRTPTNINNISFNAPSTGGNVGIGTYNPQAKLDVGGGIRPGSDSQVTVCDTTTEGTQRYNYTAHNMEYCGGTPLQWRVMGAPIAACRLEYRFTRNNLAWSGPWRSVWLNGTSNSGQSSNWAVTDLTSECNGIGCGIQMRVVCP